MASLSGQGEQALVVVNASNGNIETAFSLPESFGGIIPACFAVSFVVAN